MPEVKNTFIGAKMNKDLNPRLISNKEYIDARNASIINSEDDNSGVLQNVSGTSIITSFGLTDTRLEIIGFYIDDNTDRVFVFITNFTDSSNSGIDNYSPTTGNGASHYICMHDARLKTNQILVGGRFLNFSKSSRVLGVDIIEDFLFFTDNRNQPRKINISSATSSPYGSANPYYTKEQHISVAKYYPYKPISLNTLDVNGNLAVGSLLRLKQNYTGLGPDNTITTVTQASTGVSVIRAGVVITGLLWSINIEILSGSIVSATVNSSGNSFKVGDLVTLASGGPITGGYLSLSFEITRNNIVQFSGMKDVVSPNLPKTETKTGITSITTTSFDIGSSISTNWAGAIITAVSSSGADVLTVNENILVTSVSGSTINHTTTSALSATDTVTIGANPYYDANSSIDEQFLSDKFVKFSYRFRFDDDENSLIAPFTQAAFVPKQDGYFLDTAFPEDITASESDEVKAIKSTIISFFENKINRVNLALLMPDGVTVDTLNSELKVKEIDILYKDSNDLSIKVIDTVAVAEIEKSNDANFLIEGLDLLPFLTSDPGGALQATYTLNIPGDADTYTSGSGVALVLEITINSSGQVAQAQIINVGSGFIVGDTISLDLPGATESVVFTLTEAAFQAADSSEYNYIYNSEKPIRTLPQKEITRVSDRVPIRAKAQAISGNRVMYGNLLLKSTSLDSIDYSVSAVVKSSFADRNLLVEYPNHTLKQNRTYQVGIVLVDLFGRQSDVITSKESTIFHSYLSQLEQSSEIIGANKTYLGDVLRFTLNSEIPSTYNLPGYIGLYSETNPLGWYTYKVVVKQQEQSYYNIYLPTILNNYPATSSSVSNDTSFITLFSDNINKVPRDLQEVGPQQLQFSSSVNLFGRVENTTFSTANYTNKQFYPEKTPDKVVLIGTRDEIGLNKDEAGNAYTNSPFFSIPKIAEIGGNPYIGKVSIEKVIGGINSSVTFNDLRLNVYETEPTFSNLDIFWETTTSGLISEINEDISTVQTNFLRSIKAFNFLLNENNAVDTELVSIITPQDWLGNDVVNANTNIVLISVTNGVNTNVTSDFEILKNTTGPSINTFYIRNKRTFVYTSNSVSVDNYTFEFKLINNVDGIAYETIVVEKNNKLLNAIPTFDGQGADIVAGNIQELQVGSFDWKDIYSLNAFNGTVDADVNNQKLGLAWFITDVEFYWEGGNTWTGYPDALGIYNIMRVATRPGQVYSNVSETIQFNQNFRTLNIYATDINDIKAGTGGGSGKPGDPNGAPTTFDTEIRIAVEVRDANPAAGLTKSISPYYLTMTLTK